MRKSGIEAKNPEIALKAALVRSPRPFSVRTAIQIRAADRDEHRQQERVEAELHRVRQSRGDLDGHAVACRDRFAEVEGDDPLDEPAVLLQQRVVQAELRATGGDVLRSRGDARGGADGIPPMARERKKMRVAISQRLRISDPVRRTMKPTHGDRAPFREDSSESSREGVVTVLVITRSVLRSVLAEGERVDEGALREEAHALPSTHLESAAMVGTQSARSTTDASASIQSGQESSPPICDASPCFWA